MSMTLDQTIERLKSKAEQAYRELAIAAANDEEIDDTTLLQAIQCTGRTVDQFKYHVDKIKQRHAAIAELDRIEELKVESAETRTRNHEIEKQIEAVEAEMAAELERRIAPLKAELGQAYERNTLFAMEIRQDQILRETASKIVEQQIDNLSARVHQQNGAALSEQEHELLAIDCAAKVEAAKSQLEFRDSAEPDDSPRRRAAREQLARAESQVARQAELNERLAEHRRTVTDPMYRQIEKLRERLADPNTIDFVAVPRDEQHFTPTNPSGWIR